MSKINKKIGFIGSGNMGEVFVGALIQTGIFSSSMIYASDISEKRLDILNKTYGISVMKDNFKLFSECEIVILAVKPQHIYQVLSQISEHEDYQIPNRKIVISIAAGIPLRKTFKLVGKGFNNYRKFRAGKKFDKWTQKMYEELEDVLNFSGDDNFIIEM